MGPINIMSDGVEFQPGPQPKVNIPGLGLKRGKVLEYSDEPRGYIKDRFADYYTKVK